MGVFSLNAVVRGTIVLNDVQSAACAAVLTFYGGAKVKEEVIRALAHLTDLSVRFEYTQITFIGDVCQFHEVHCAACELHSIRKLLLKG